MIAPVTLTAAEIAADQQVIDRFAGSWRDFCDAVGLVRGPGDDIVDGALHGAQMLGHGRVRQVASVARIANALLGSSGPSYPEIVHHWAESLGPAMAFDAAWCPLDRLQGWLPLLAQFLGLERCEARYEAQEGWLVIVLVVREPLRSSRAAAWSRDAAAVTAGPVIRTGHLEDVRAWQMPKEPPVGAAWFDDLKEKELKDVD